MTVRTNWFIKLFFVFRSAVKTNGPIIFNILVYESRDHKEKLSLLLTRNCNLSETRLLSSYFERNVIFIK